MNLGDARGESGLHSRLLGSIWALQARDLLISWMSPKLFSSKLEQNTRLCARWRELLKEDRES